MKIRAQPGPQTAFLQTKANVAIYGGAAGGGKSFGILLEPLRNIRNPRFGAVVFRRNTTQVRNQGGLWDQSEELYPLVGAVGARHTLTWRFPSGATVRFGYMDQDKDRYKYQGAQIPLICFDELTHFSETQFFYMFSRNRSTCGVTPYIRATCNPDPDSFVARLMEWY